MPWHSSWPRAEPRRGRQRGQGQDKPIPGAELLAAAGGRRRGLSPLSFTLRPQRPPSCWAPSRYVPGAGGSKGAWGAALAAGLVLGKGLRVPSAAAGPRGRYCWMTDAAVSENPARKKGRKSESPPRKPEGSHLLRRVPTKPGSPAAPDWGGPGDKRTGWEPGAAISPEALQPPAAASASF